MQSEQPLSGCDAAVASADRLYPNLFQSVHLLRTTTVRPHDRSYCAMLCHVSSASAGRAAGMICVGVLTGMAGPDTLAPLADVVLPDIGHLPAWLDGRAAAAG